MATVAESGLFPPLIDTYMPAQSVDDITQNGGFKIKFNISPYNDISDITEIHVSITRQSNYNSLLLSSNYPMGIWITRTIPTPGDDGNIELRVPFSALNENQFAYNEYYKIQIRLAKNTEPFPGTGKPLSDYLSKETNLATFSEWSTVCLGRMIAPSSLSLDANGVAFVNNVKFTSSNILLSGKYEKANPQHIFPNESSINNGQNDKEYLSQYKITIKQLNEIIFESPIIDININDKKEIYYQIPYFFENGNYQIIINYLTANLYQGTTSFNFSVNVDQNQWGMQSKVSEALAVDTVIGKVNITFLPGSSIPVPEPPAKPKIPSGLVFTIRRASDKDNYQYWNTMWTKTVPEGGIESLTFDDFTIESGVLYQYEISFFDNETKKIYYIVVSNVISVFDHAFLTGEGTQLCVKFNPNISNYKVNVSDSITTTIGGKQPYITRNGDMYYRSFSLSGTIAYEMDAEHQFATRSSIYGDYINIYGTYFVNRYFNTRNDRVTQRKFRELVMNYLYDDVPKLFRSTPEGNILVRLTDVTLTPNQQLGRMIYDFSCTATEIGDCTIDNYKLYQIQDFGEQGG